jgi:hypothetical protein
MIEFKKYELENSVEELGTVADQIGTKGKITFVKKNFLDESKRVVILAYNEAGESAIVACSEQLSKALRRAKNEGASKDSLLASVLDQPVYANEVGTFIGMVSGDAPQAKSVAELRKQKGTVVLAVEEIPW